MPFCPICGKRLPKTEALDVPPPIGMRQHRCNDRSIIAMDAAMRRDPDEEDPRDRPFGQRLYEGFKMLEADD